MQCAKPCAIHTLTLPTRHRKELALLSKEPLHSWLSPSSEKRNPGSRRGRIMPLREPTTWNRNGDTEAQPRKKRSTRNTSQMQACSIWPILHRSPLKVPWKWVLKLNLNGFLLPQLQMGSSLRARLGQSLQTIKGFLGFLVLNTTQAFWEVTGILGTKHNFAIFKDFTI